MRQCGCDKRRREDNTDRARHTGGGRDAQRNQSQQTSLDVEDGELAWDTFGQDHRPPSAPTRTPSEASTVPAVHRLEGGLIAVPDDVARLGRIVSGAMMQKIKRGEVTVAQLNQMPGITAARELTLIKEGEEEEEEIREEEETQL